MGEIKWIKISTNIFDNRKIKQIEALPDGAKLLIIWVKLLCLAGDVNDRGAVYITKEIPYTENTLATAFNTSVNTIILALNVFEQYGMIEIINNFIYVSNWEKYQSTDKMEIIREQTKLRVQKYRQKQLDISKNDSETSCNVTCNADVTLRNAIDKDIDIEKEKELNNIKHIVSVNADFERKRIENELILDSKKPKEIKIKTEEQQVFDFWNSKQIIVHKEINEPMLKAIKARLKEHSIQQVLESIENYNQALFDTNYFFEYKWSLQDFLNRKNAFTEFLNEGAKTIAYQNFKNKSGSKTGKAKQSCNFASSIEELDDEIYEMRCIVMEATSSDEDRDKAKSRIKQLEEWKQDQRAKIDNNYNFEEL